MRLTRLTRDAAGAGSVSPEAGESADERPDPGADAGGPANAIGGGPDPAPQAAPPADDPATISWTRLLDERPDVLRAYYESFYRDRDPHSHAWSERVGGVTPEAYAKYWYAEHGRYEGYNQGPTTAGDNVSLSRILDERPDVLRAFYEQYYGAGNDRHSDAWIKRVGGDTPEAYARYWYDKYGKWEGYAQSDKAAAENIDVERLLTERPDVFRAFFTEFYGPNNDRKSSAWADRVGGETVQDYAKYWYVTYGKAQGYSQAPHAAPGDGDSAPTPGTEEPAPEDTTPDAGGTTSWPADNDPSLDPWNHPAIFPDWRPPYEGWQPPPAGHSSASAAHTDEGELAVDGDVAAGVGLSLSQPDLIV